MLTLAKIATYQLFGGDADGWSRERSSDRSGITDQDWRLIEELRHGIILVSSGQASPEFTVTFERRLAASVPDKKVRQAIRELTT
ncbi:hypothetical protein HDE76_001240 [Rhodanobacter sp. ANJX3]|jgi:hypothetical protein|uniref:hypothetical protein n=1 Tax=Rhodanobacter sp. ANJX3 TaxID=2723083 RepID=UPI0016125320|nr:hypothetical protein [Rhodanobacter sp. ANJX3]MBB5358034.1 hypothetical protein [Rhodanobacter sp. ANJX3]